MKMPDDLVKGLDVLQRKLESIEQLESTVSQVSKALCGKENATLDELLQAVDQLKSRLAQVERERDAAVEDFTQFVIYGEHECRLCRHYEEVCLDCTWEWRGVKINDE